MSSRSSFPVLMLRASPSATYTAWILWWGLAVMATLLTLAAWRLGTQDHARAAALTIDLSQLGASQEAQLAKGPALDFATSLGTLPDSSRYLRALDRAAADAGVSITSVLVSEQVATVAELGRLQFAIVLKGSYAGNKQVLAEVMARFSGTGVQSLRMRVDPATGAIETTATLSLWAAPQR